MFYICNHTIYGNNLLENNHFLINKYLISKSFSNETVGLHKCNLCNFYTSNTLKGLAAHKRGCKKKVK